MQWGDLRKLAVVIGMALCLPVIASSSALSAKTKTKAKGPPPAKLLFGHKKLAAPLAPQAIGFYSRGCLAGGVQLAATGPAWQAMRLKRNRNWAHPELIAIVKKLAIGARKYDGWNGLLVGDMTQPRGGPMLTGHASHQVGLDADIWLREMPKRTLSHKMRDTFQPISMLKNRLSVNPKRFTDKHIALIKRAASFPQVQRIGVNRAIKRALCQRVKGDRRWLAKIRPWGGHHYHMHIRLKCPKGSTNCKGQSSPGTSDGCAAVEKWHRNLKAWLALPKKERIRRIRKANKNKKPKRRKRQITLAQLPKACRTVLSAKPARHVLTRGARLLRSGKTGLDEARAILGRK